MRKKTFEEKVSDWCLVQFAAFAVALVSEVVMVLCSIRLVDYIALLVDLIAGLVGVINCIVLFVHWPRSKKNSHAENQEEK